MLNEHRKAQYKAEIEAWNWEKIVQHAEENAYQQEESVNGSTLLGSLLDVPSGKFYLPFACSNVEPCPHCQGQGSVKNLNANPVKYKELDEIQHKSRMSTLKWYGPFFEGKWPEENKRLLDDISKERDNYTETLTCPFCDGLGSEEARLDELYLEALDEVADEHGGWIECEDDRFFVTNLGNLDDDIIFADPGFLYEGEVVANSEEELRAWMEENSYFPNVWWISDHGDIGRYTWET